MEDFNSNNDCIDKNKYQRFGFQYAQDSGVNPEIIHSGLAKVLAEFREDSRYITKLRIEKLKADITILKNQETVDTATLKIGQLVIEAKGDEIKFLRKQQDEIKDRKSDTAESINIGLQLFGLVVLLLFLYVFYASVGYSVLHEAKHISSAILNPNVFAEAARQGGAAIAIVYLIPALILVFGLLIHWFLGKITKEKEKKKKVQWIILLVAFILAAFCFDAIAGYKISQNAHNALVDNGLEKELWHFSLVFKDINFYVVLILGFVAYLAWGILLHAFISNPIFNLNDQIKRFDEKITQANKELLDVKQQVIIKEIGLSDLQDKIMEKEKSLNNYENGGVYYDIEKFRGVIGIFMEGYSSYVTPFYNNQEKAKQVMNVAKQEQIKWENDVIPSLTTEK
jgi:hypothetical protein